MAEVKFSGVEFSGSANSSGFQITATIVWCLPDGTNISWRKATVQSQGYGKDNGWRRWLTRYITYIYRRYRRISLALDLALPSIFKNLKEWHGAEHKLVNALADSKDKLTLKGLAATNINSDCGVSNRCLLEPSQEKIEEALKVGKRLLEDLSRLWLQ